MRPPPALTMVRWRAFSACGAAPAGSLAHVGIADVKVGDDPVSLSETEEGSHVLVIGDRSGAPDAGEAEGVGRELHVLDGRSAGRVVLQGLDLITAGGGDHRDDHRRPEGLLSLAADPTRRHLLVLPFSLGLQAGRLGPRPGQLAAPLARKHVEAPRLGDPVVGGVHGALQDVLDEVFRHRVLPNATDALTRLYSTDHIQRSSWEVSPT